MPDYSYGLLHSHLNNWTVYPRESVLMRGKWDEQRGGETYGERTIRMALDSTDGVLPTG